VGARKIFLINCGLEAFSISEPYDQHDSVQILKYLLIFLFNFKVLLKEKRLNTSYRRLTYFWFSF